MPAANRSAGILPAVAEASRPGLEKPSERPLSAYIFRLPCLLRWQSKMFQLPLLAFLRRVAPNQ